jgi:DNA-binding HxlR family transcriptional regulator
LDVVANKWSALVIGALADGPLRFKVLQRRLEGISGKVLTSTLRRLETFALVDRQVFAAVPAKVEYSLSPAGREALVPVTALRDWAETHLAYASQVVPKG